MYRVGRVISSQGRESRSPHEMRQISPSEAYGLRARNLRKVDVGGKANSVALEARENLEARRCRKHQHEVEWKGFGKGSRICTDWMKGFREGSWYM